MPIQAYVLGKVVPQKHLEVLENLRKIDCVECADFVYGTFDFIAKINAEDLNVLKKVVIERIRKLDNVEKTQTLVVSEV